MWMVTSQALMWSEYSVLDTVQNPQRLKVASTGSRKGD